MTLALLGLAACAVAPPLAFTHAAVLAPDGAGLLADQTVVLRDGVIAAIGPAPDVAVPDGARAIDATGQILVPGLVDAHVHLDADAPVQPRPEFGDGPAFLRMASPRWSTCAAGRASSPGDSGSRAERSTDRR